MKKKLPLPAKGKPAAPAVTSTPLSGRDVQGLAELEQIHAVLRAIAAQGKAMSQAFDQLKTKIEAHADVIANAVPLLHALKARDAEAPKEVDIAALTVKFEEAAKVLADAVATSKPPAGG